MFRGPFSKILSSAKKTFEKNSTRFNSFTYKSQFKFSRFDRFFGESQRPLYQYIIGTNLAIYLAWNSNIVSKQFLMNNFTLSLDTMARNHYHTLFTYSVSHIGFMHMFFNMFTLYFFGRFTEGAFGPRVLMHLYLAGALAGALMIHFSNKKYHNYYPTVGASGATSAILSFFIFKYPQQQILLFFFPVPAWMVGVLILVQSFMMIDSRGGISGSAHLGGIGAGFLYFLATRGRL